MSSSEEPTIKITMTTGECARLATHLTLIAEYAASSLALLEKVTGIDFSELAAAQAGEAGTATTPQSGVVHEHAVGNADAPKGAA